MGFSAPIFSPGGGAVKAATPSFSPGAGTYSGTQSVTLSTVTQGANIRYTTDGSTPSQTHGTLYTDPVVVTYTETLKAVATLSGYLDSDVASAAYTIAGRPADDLEASLRDDCSIYWKLEEASGDRIPSKGSVSLVPTSTPGNAAGKIGNAVDITTTKYLKGNTQPSVEGGALFEIVGWVKYGNDANWGFVVAKTNGSTREFRLYRYTSNSMFWMAGNIETTVESIQRVVADGWGFFSVGFSNLAGSQWMSFNNGAQNIKTGAATVAAGTSQFEVGHGDVTMTGQVDEVGMWHRALRPVERAALYNSGAGLTYPFSGIAITNAFKVVTADVWDSENLRTDLDIFTRFAPLSRVVFQTTATSMDVYAYTSIYGSFANYAHIAVWVDGVYQEKLALTANGFQKFTVTLAAGNKTVVLVNGLSSRPSATILGTWVRDVVFNATTSLQLPNMPATRMCVYGDSIAAGGNSTTPGQHCYAQLLRADLPIVVEAYGYRSLKDDCDTAPHQTALVNAIAATNPGKVWIAMGVNDYQLNKWSAANFKTAYQSFLTELHAALPAATIYAQCPIQYDGGTEPANSFGDNLDAYRTAVSNAVTDAGVGSYQNAKTWLTLAHGDFNDAVHPNTSGHAIYYGKIKTALGL